MPDTKISAGADPGSVVATDKVPMARSASTTAYAATMAELATYANGAYVPNYYTGTPSMDGTGAAGTAAFVARGDHVHPSDTSRLPLAGGTMAGFLTLNANPTANLHAATKQYVDGSAPVGGPYVAIANMHDVGRNLLHNPLFNVAQRGAGPWSTWVYTVDRWQFYVNLDTSNILRNPAALGGIPGDEACNFVMITTIFGNAGAAAQTIFFQPIEDVRRLANKTVTVSFYAQASAAGMKLGVSADQNFGTGGSPSAAVYGNGQAVSLTTGWARYSLTFTLASVAGKTLGTNGNDNTGLNIWYSCGATNATRAGNIGVQSGSINIWGVQLEIGSVATPLEKPDPRYDLANCQRFYQIGQMIHASYNAVGAGVYYTLALSVTMRAIPAVTFANTTSGNMSGFTAGAYNGTNVWFNAVTIATGPIVLAGTYTASADL